MEQKEKRLIEEEQRYLDRLISKMDARMLAYNKRLTEDQLRMRKAKGWKDAYGEFIDAKYDGIHVNERKETLRMSRNALYQMRIELECHDLDGKGGVEKENLKIGLHTYAYNGEIFIVSWKMPVCRQFMFNDNAVEYIGTVFNEKFGDKYRTHYQLKLKRRIDLDFDEVTGVTQMYPLTAEEEQIIVDQFLQDLLRRRNEQEFQNIVFSIQKRQGEIIQVPFRQNMIVQGCAGSGKSMIMLHRLPILLDDNAGTLNRNSIYVITPSEAYIQMMAGLREDLELEDLRMGTIEDYFNYSIERYGRKAEDCGRINPLLKLPQYKVDFVYSSNLLTKSIRWRIESAINDGRIDLNEGRKVFDIKAREKNSSCYRDVIRDEILSIQDLLSQNDAVLRDYSSGYKQALQSFRDLAQTLKTRRMAEERSLLKEIDGLQREIQIRREEISKLNRLTNFLAIRNRQSLNRDAETRIESLQQQIRELPDHPVYSRFERFAEQIEAYISTIDIGKDPDEHREQYKSRSAYQKAKNDYIEQLYNTISVKRGLDSTITAIENQLDQVDGGDTTLIKNLYLEQLQSAKKSVERYSAIQKKYLRYDYYKALLKTSEFYNKLLENVERTTYINIMSYLGFKTDERGRLFVPSCAPYVYLTVLYECNGVINSTRESMIAIDEAQNYTPGELQLLNAINGGKVVFNLFGDIKQRIEGEKGISNWSELSEVADFQIYDLRENYRNALQITNECNRRFHMDMEPINIKGTGVREFSRPRDFDIFVEKRIQRSTKPGLSCVIFKHQQEMINFLNEHERFKTYFHNPAQNNHELSLTKWNIMTVDQVKGLEFNAVMAVTGRMTVNEKYVTFTRALDELVILDQEYGSLDTVKITNEDGLHTGDDIEPVPSLVEETGNNDAAAGTRKHHEEPAIRKSNKAKSELVEFFKSKGFEVIDRRSKTGLLWVIGTREELKDTIREASRKYRITGQFGKDADTNGRQGWYTKSYL